MIKSDNWIANKSHYYNMINPFANRQVRYREDCGCTFCQSVEHDPNNKQRVISFGVSSYGYDIRLDRYFKVFTNANMATLDPKNMDSDAFIDKTVQYHDYILVPPNSFVLGTSYETFDIPGNVIAIVLGKSTYARVGIVVNCTPMEPRWRGELTIEISNTTTLPVKIYAGEGIAQALFYESDEECRTSYDQRAGKYQDQKGIQVAKV